MKYNISEAEGALRITVHDVGENQAKLLTLFGLCQEGKCGCPTTEYEKMESIDVTSDRNTVVLTLKPKQREQLKREEIEECLAFTFAVVRG